MLKFAIYDFELKKDTNSQPLLPGLAEGDVRVDVKKYASATECFEALFPSVGKNISLWSVKKRKGGNSSTAYADGQDPEGEKDEHRNEILYHSSNIVVMKVQANRSKTLSNEDWKQQKEAHHPPYYVILDIRPGSCLMAVEKKSGASDSPDSAAKMLAHSFNRLMNGLIFHYSRRESKKPFWDTVIEFSERRKDKVQAFMVSFDNSATETDSASMYFALQNMFCKRSDEYGFWWNVGEQEQLEAWKTDVEKMAALCLLNRRYTLGVRFRDFGQYQYGHATRAMMGMEEDVLEKCIGTAVQMDAFDNNCISLPIWLDNVKELLQDYDSNQSVQQKRNSGNRIGAR